MRGTLPAGRAFGSPPRSNRCGWEAGTWQPPGHTHTAYLAQAVRGRFGVAQAGSGLCLVRVPATELAAAHAIHLSEPDAPEGGMHQSFYHQVQPTFIEAI